MLPPAQMLAIKKPRPRVLLALLLAGLCVLAACAPKGPRALLEGDRLIREGRFAQAVKVLEEARKTMPDDPRLWNWLGMAYHGAGDKPQALEAYKRALTLDRSNMVFSAHYNLGLLYLETGNPAAAVTELRSYCQLSNTGPALLQLGYAELLARQHDAAERSYGQAMRLRPADPAPLNGLGMVYASRNRPREAVQFFQGALRLDPKYHPAMLNLITLHYQQPGQKHVALDLYGQYQRLHPAAPGSDAMRAFLKQLDTEQAAVTLVSNAPSAVASSTNEAVAARATGQARTNAVAALTQAVVAVAATNPPPSHTALVARTNSLALSATQAIAAATLNQGRATNVAAKPPVHSPVATQAPPPLVVTKVTPPITTNRPTGPILVVTQQTARVSPPPAAPSQTTTAVAVVQLADEAPPKPARDEDPAPPVSRAVASAAISASPSHAASSDSEATATPHEKPAKRSLFQKINPFKRKSKPETKTDAPADSVAMVRATPVEAQVTNTPAPTPANQPLTPQPTAPPPKPTPPPAPRVEPPRYQYLDLAKPAPGNRAAAEPLVAAGYQAQRARKLDEAARQYTAALQKDPSYFEACYNLTLVALDVGDLRAALHASELAVAIKPESAEARVTLATALDRSGYWNDAVDQLEKVLKTSPEDVKAHLLLGNVFAQKLNLPGRARPHYQRVIEIEPRHPRASEIRYWLAANP